jgi:uncharacterized membrane protein
MNDTLSITRIILSFAFIVVALMQIFGTKPVKNLFAEFKLNRAAMVLIGMIELLLVTALYIQHLSFYASIGLAYICTTALFRHIKANHPFTYYLPAVGLLILSMVTAILLLR